MHKSMVITDETKFIAFGPITIYKIYGRNNTASAVYIQFHEAPTVAASDVPATKALEASANTWFDWSFEKGLSLTQLLLAMSSTQINYTALVDAGLDCTIEYETNYDVDSNTTIVGDLTTGVASRQIWTDASGPKSLKRLDVKNNSGATAYVWIAARDLADITVTLSTHRGPFSVANGATLSQFAGAGITPYAQLLGVSYRGCAVIATTTAALGGTKIAAASFNIRGVYG